MSSTTPVHEPYNYQRPAVSATRAIVSEPSTNNPSNMASEYHPPASHERQSGSASSKNYEQALAERAVGTTSDSSTAEPKVVAGLAYRGDNADSTTNRPGLLGRQQSWSTADQKRAQMEQMLNTGGDQPSGYSSTASGKQ